MTEIDNPPAFPRPASVGNNYVTGEEGVTVDPQKGMTLRDYFAAKAMLGLMTRWYESSLRDSTTVARDEISALSYEIADAMLAARKA